MDEQKEALNNPWLAAPKPTGLMSREALEDRILNLLSSQNMAVIATVAPDGSPSATPVRYPSLGMEIMYTSWNATPKSRNLRLDPRVSVGIFAPLVGPASSREHSSSAPRERWSGTTRKQTATGPSSVGKRTRSRTDVRCRSHQPIR